MASYIESTDRPNESRVAGEDVDVGEAVALEGDGTAVPFDGDGHTIAENFGGVADNPLTGDQIAEDDDATESGTYLAAENDRVIFGGDGDTDRIKLRTAEDNETDPAPSIEDGDVVGFIDTSDTIDSADEFTGRIVEEGYTDDDDTTYDRDSDNFEAVGVAYRDEGDGYDTPVRVEVRKGL